MAYKISQTVIKDGQAIFKTDDVVRLSTTVTEDIVGRVNSIKPSGNDYVINIDSSTEYNSKYQDVNLSSITEAEVIGNEG